MSIVRVLIAAFLLLSVLPLEAFCKDSHCIEETGHCETACCHSLHYQAVLSQSEVSAVLVVASQVFQSYERSYENPILSRLIKPPIVLS